MPASADAAALVRRLTIAFALVCAFDAFAAERSPGASTRSTPAVIAFNEALGDGINLGNALDAPSEGEWGPALESDWFDLVAEAGFDSVRVPIRWSAHAAGEPPYEIEDAFFERVDWALSQAARAGLRVVINTHHYDALMADPTAERARFLALWEQIAARYADAPATVAFELLNEPEGVFNDDPPLWNALLAEALARVRRSNPARAVLVGPVRWQNVFGLDSLELPDDPNLIVSVHYYRPLAFTHQGASFSNPRHPVGVEWHGERLELAGAPPPAGDAASLRGRDDHLEVRLADGAELTLYEGPPLAPRTRRLEARGRAELSIACGPGEKRSRALRLDTGEGRWTSPELELEHCAGDTRRVTLRNDGSGAASFALRDARLCDARRCRPLVASARSLVERDIVRIRRWGERHGRPINLGEFGAFDEADLASRVRWTRTVRALARAAGFSTHYWAFGTRFGVYDLEEGRWHRRLLEALSP